MGGTLASVMAVVGVPSLFESMIASAILAVTATDTTLRAVLAIALAIVALVAIDRMKPTAPKRPAMVPVERKAAPLYREPERPQRQRAIASLTVGSIIVGACIACVLGFAVAVALEIVGGLLRA